ncbi:MAG: 30S ribosomal protein S6 [Minisyncoccia bacterium]
MENNTLENIFYELTFFLSSKLNDKEAEEKFNNLIKEIEELKSSVLETSLPRLEFLAYPIKKETSGYFCLVKFKIERELIQELEKKLKLMPEILRYLLLKKEEITQKFESRKKYQVSLKRGKSELGVEKPEKEKEVSLEELDKKLNEILKE